MQKQSSASNFMNSGGDFLLILLGALLLCLLFAMLTSCKQTEYITVPEVHIEHVYHNDTVKVTDSIKSEKETIIREARPEDSIMLAKMGIKLHDNERLLIMLQRELENAKSELIEHKSDSVFVHDSVAVPYPVEKIVEKKYTPGFVKFLAWAGGLGILALIIGLVIKLTKYISF